MHHMHLHALHFLILGLALVALILFGGRGHNWPGGGSHA